MWVGVRHAQDVLGLAAMHDDWGQMSNAIGNLYAGLNLDIWDAVAFAILAGFLCYPWVHSRVDRWRYPAKESPPVVPTTPLQSLVDHDGLVKLVQESGVGRHAWRSERQALEDGVIEMPEDRFRPKQQAARFVREHPEAVMSDGRYDVLVVRRWLDQQIQRELGLWD